MCAAGGRATMHPMSRPVLLLSHNGDVVARGARWHERLVARWRAPHLDDELARGADPDGSPLLALRARRLLSARVRASFARELRGIVDEARSGPHRLTRVEPPRRQVMAAADDLEALADRLGSAGLLSVRGVAEVAVLLRDGRGPLYFGTSRGALRAAVQRVAADLEPSSV
jgi:hypothetical protein